MKTIDAYIGSVPAHIQEMQEQIRATIKKAAPAAEETIKYNMPAFMLYGANMVYFAELREG